MHAAVASKPLSAASFKAALSVTSDSVLLIDRAGVVVYANPAAEVALRDDDLQGRRWNDIWRLERSRMCAIWRDVQSTGRWSGTAPRLRSAQAAHPEHPAEHAADEKADSARSRSPQMTLMRLEAQPGEDEHFCVVMHARSEPSYGDAQVDAECDATDNKSGSRSSEAIAALQRLASEIAHDFNNQIAVVLNYTFVLLRQMPADSPLKLHVAEMQAAAWRASQVAQDIRRTLLASPALQAPK